MASNRFIPTVATATVRDKVNDIVVIRGKTLVNSNVDITNSNSEIAGGEFHQLLYSYDYGRRGEIAITDAKIDQNFWAVNLNQSIVNATRTDVLELDKKVTLDGTGESPVLDPAPVGVVYVQNPDTGIYQTVTPVGDKITIAGLANREVEVIYNKSANVDAIEIDASSFPNAYELTLSVKSFEQTGLKEIYHFVFDNWKPSGSFSLPFASESPVQNTLTGMMLANDGTYGRILREPVSAEIAKYEFISAQVSELTLNATDTFDLITRGWRGGNYSAELIPSSSLTFAVVGGGSSVVTVNSSGQITAVATGSAEVSVTLNSDNTKTDIINVTVS